MSTALHSQGLYTAAVLFAGFTLAEPLQAQTPDPPLPADSLQQFLLTLPDSLARLVPDRTSPFYRFQVQKQKLLPFAENPFLEGDSLGGNAWFRLYNGRRAGPCLDVDQGMIVIPGPFDTAMVVVPDTLVDVGMVYPPCAR